MAGGAEGDECGFAGGAFDDAAAIAVLFCGFCAVREKLAGQADEFAEPIEDFGFEFAAGGAGEPEHALHAQARGKEFAEDGGVAGVGGEEGEEVGGLPVGEAGEDGRFEIGENRGPFGGDGGALRRGVFRCVGGERVVNFVGGRSERVVVSAVNDISTGHAHKSPSGSPDSADSLRLN